MSFFAIIYTLDFDVVFFPSEFSVASGVKRSKETKEPAYVERKDEKDLLTFFLCVEPVIWSRLF